MALVHRPLRMQQNRQARLWMCCFVAISLYCCSNAIAEIAGNEMVQVSRAATLVGHRGQIRQVKYSSNGKLLATCSDDGTTKVWSVPSWSEVATLRGHIGPVYTVEFLADDRGLITGGQDGIIRRWSVSTFRQEASHDTKCGAVISIGRMRTDHRFVVQFVDRTYIGLLDIVNGTIEKVSLRDQIKGTVEASALFNKVPRLAVGGIDAAAALVNLEKWKVENRVQLLPNDSLLPTHSTKLMSLAISSDDHMLASSCGFKVNSVVTLASVVDGKVRATLDCNDGTIWAICFSPDGQRIACAGRRLQIWDVATRKVVFSADADGGTDDIALRASVFAYSLCYSPNGKWLVAGGSSDNVAIWECNEAPK